ncbi:hypothetical protein ABW19_dt0203340 [Dactylella cylindrospora]|nr:hypothetical protein ABW19_dt0203340 [Dactylella cylindrospora]
MRVGLFQQFHPNSGLRQWARTRTFAGTSKPHSLYICGFRRKNFYRLMFFLFLIVLAIALAVGISVSNRVRRIRAQRNGVVGADGSRGGMTLPGSRIFVPTATRTITTVTEEDGRMYTIQYEEPYGITYQLSRGSIIPATSYILLNTFTPATFSFGRVITTVQGGVTNIVSGTTSVISPTETRTTGGTVVTLGVSTTVVRGETSIISPTATMTSGASVVTLGPSTMVVGGTTSISGGTTLTTYTTIPFTVTSPRSSAGPASSSRVFVYNDPGGGVIIVPADQSGAATPSIVTLSSVPSDSSTSSGTGGAAGPSSAGSVPGPAPTPTSGGGGGGPSPGTGQTFSGDATYYDPGLGACGIVNSASDLIAAIGHALFESAGVANSNHNPYCGRQIIVRNQGGFSRRSENFNTTTMYNQPTTLLTKTKQRHSGATHSISPNGITNSQYGHDSKSSF